MRSSIRFLLAPLTLVLLALVAVADEEKVPVDKLPKKVVDAVKAKYPDAELVKASKEKEDGKVLYEVNVKNKGQKIDVTFTEDGKFVSEEKEIAAKDLPKEVSAALEGKYPKAEIKRAEDVTEGEKKYFEILLVTADKKTMEVQIDAKGKILKEEKKEPKKKEEKKEEKKDK
jgi:uncharacterized membrane protein YkoI